MIGIIGPIESFITSKDGNVYAVSNKGVYKCWAGQTSFTQMTGTSGQIESLTTDNNSNIYTGSDKGVYKFDKEAQEQELEMSM